MVVSAQDKVGGGRRRAWPARILTSGKGLREQVPYAVDSFVSYAFFASVTLLPSLIVMRTSTGRLGNAGVLDAHALPGLHPLVTWFARANTHQLTFSATFRAVTANPVCRKS